jgi:chromosomal replication initiation ATPase DnaA
MKQIVINIPDQVTMVNVNIIIRDHAYEVTTDNEFDPQQIIDQASLYSGYPVDVLMSPSRQKNISDARKLIFMKMKQYTKLSLGEMGALLNRDHATALNAIRKGYGWIDTKDKDFTKLYNEFSEILQNLLSTKTNIVEVTSN